MTILDLYVPETNHLLLEYYYTKILLLLFYIFHLKIKTHIFLEQYKVLTIKQVKV